MGTKANPDQIGVGYRELKINLAGLPADQWDRLDKIKVYVNKPTGLSDPVTVTKSAIDTILKIASVGFDFYGEGMYFVAVTLFFTDGKYLAQPVGNYDYLFASGIVET
jgi:hypothetical protein